MSASTRSRPLARLWRYARGHRGSIALATLFSVLNKLFDLAPPVLIGAAVDIVVQREDSFTAAVVGPDITNQLWALAVLTVIIWGCESAFQYAYELQWRGLAQRIQHDLRLDAYRHVQGLEMAYFEDRSTGGLMAVLNDDINQLERFLDSGANDLIQLMTTALTVGALFIVIVPSVAWMAVVPIPIVLGGSLWFQRKLESRYARVRSQVASLNSQLSNNLGGIATIKSFTAEDHEVRAIDASSRAYEQANRKAIKLSSAFVPLIRMAIVLGFAAILVYAGKMVANDGLNVGVYSVLVFMTQRLLWPFTRLGTMLDQYQRAMASTTRALDLLATKPGIVSGSKPLPKDEVAGDVAFESVTFAYRSGDDRVPVLDDFDVRLPAGQTIAFVGSTGAGKSTIAKLLLRFYDVDSGRITIDGHDIRDLDVRDLRAAIGLVSQDVYLFHGTVRDNIAYGSFEASDESIVEAARLAEADDFIRTLPSGYDTIVGERGQKLSGGQRQRISVARAILKDPPILILDEATSAVDNETEAAIQRSLRRIARDRTTMVIAHRLSTVRHAHRTYVLADGKVVESGTHEQLVAAAGVYSTLWRVQTGDQADAA